MSNRQSREYIIQTSALANNDNRCPSSSACDAYALLVVSDASYLAGSRGWSLCDSRPHSLNEACRLRFRLTVRAWAAQGIFGATRVTSTRSGTFTRVPWLRSAHEV